MRHTCSTRARWLLCFALFLGLPAVNDAGAQRDRQVDPSTESEYSKKFFDQLRTLFGRFREADLDRAFETAQPIQCSELVSDDGKWRPVAFFNENRRLGDWYHGTLEEVKRELSEYRFSGTCTSDRSNVQIATKFPIGESIDRYNAGRLEFDKIRLNTNPPVTASFDSKAQIYVFELPYLYVERGRGGSDILYTLIAPRADDRPAPDVTNHWECKSVRANDVTFQFLICQTWTLPSDRAERRRSQASFGSSAYFILSDGQEASTSVKLSFGGGGDAPIPPSERRELEAADRPANAAPAAPALAPTAPEPVRSPWQSPAPSSQLVDLDRGEFRVLFSAQTWTNKVATAQVLFDQKLSTLAAAKPPTGADYCLWQPGSSNLLPRILAKEPDTEVAYTLKALSKEKLVPASVSFEMKTFNGTRLGVVQCFFQKVDFATEIPFERWVSIVGAHLTIETR